MKPGVEKFEKVEEVRSAGPPPVLHPEAHTEWFRALPHERRARMNREWRTELARGRGLVLDERRALWRAGLAPALAFAIFDAICPGADLGTLVLTALLGYALGLALHALRAGSILWGTAGQVVFFLLQWVTRGGLSGAHLFWFLPVAVTFLALGQRREE